MPQLVPVLPNQKPSARQCTRANTAEATHRRCLAPTDHHPPETRSSTSLCPLPKPSLVPPMTAQILPMHAGQAGSDFGKLQTFPQKMDTGSGANDNPTSPDHDDDRGRRRDRDELDEDNGDANDGAEGTGSSRKRRRSRKGLDKKFECPHSGCGKSYSRAEHLYRHQLNRTSPLCARI